MTSFPMVVLKGERGADAATLGPGTPSVRNPTFTRVALPISMTDPAWVLMLDGRLLSSCFIQGAAGALGRHDPVFGWSPKVVVVPADGGPQ